MSYRDYKKLFDLSDILSEIESLKENSKYCSALAYFDSSTGINPTVQKLPPNLQSRWIDRASHYKKRYSVSFPPFTYFVEFIQELSITLNDPSFSFETANSNVKCSFGKDMSQYPSQMSHQKFKSSVMARKTEIDRQPMSNAQEAQRTDAKFVPYCPLHKAYHTLDKCRSFKFLPILERKELLSRNYMCFRCCESDKHLAKDCRKVIRCTDCNSNRHTTAMHDDTRYKSSDGQTESRLSHGGEPSEVEIFSKCSKVCGDKFQGKSCAKTILTKIYPEGKPERGILVYALIDDQSNRTLAKSHLFDAMNIESDSISYTLSSCNGVTTAFGRQGFGLIVESVDGEMTLKLPVVIECDYIPNARDEIPTPNVVQHFPHLKHLANYIPPENSNAPILLLIGRDLPEAHHVLEQCTGPQGSPFAQRLPLGWVVIGDVCLGDIHKSERINVNKTRLLRSGRPSFLDPCSNSFDLNDVMSVDDMCSENGPSSFGTSVFEQTKDDDKIGHSVEDRLFLQLMDQEFTKDKSGKWVAPLPFKPHRQKLPNNKSQAVKRAKLLDINLKKNPQKKEHFLKFMEEIFEKGHAELAPPLCENEECWYLPIFGVYHPKKPDQLRGVFDSSAMYNGVSLNKVLMSGPDLANSLLGVLLRFRRECIAVTADIQKMFYSFYVKTEHRNFLRFLWYKDNNPDSELVEYRMCVHVFGNSPSPAVATYGLRKTVENSKSDSDVKQFVKRDFYVDDALTSVETNDEAVSLIKRTQDVLQLDGHLRLHKIASNSRDVMLAFPEHDLAKELKPHSIIQDLLPLQYSLGLAWDLNSDTFTFRLQGSRADKPYTRRGLLSVINSIFDPLGFIAPITVQGKILLRDLSMNSVDWDEQLPPERQCEWDTWIKSLNDLEHLSIPRAYVPVSVSKALSHELHIYSDASEKAIAAVAYLKVKETDDTSHLGFILGKAKVAPSRGNTVPRLELCAAVLAVELVNFIDQHLDVTVDRTYFYTDSKVVLGYIFNQTRRFYTYVSNRVQKIRQVSSPDQWSYVPTDRNPADAATRSSPEIAQKNSQWLSGPLQYDTLASNNDYLLLDPDADKEVRPEVIVSKTAVKNLPVSLGVERFQRFSTWKKLVKGIALLKTFARMKAKVSVSSESTHVHTESERLILHEVQHEVYGEEISCFKDGKPLSRTSPIITLNPTLDDSGLLRVGGRLSKSGFSTEEKNPLIVPGKSYIAKLLVLHFHEGVHHQGRHLTEGAIRSHGFWITGVKRLVSSLIQACVKCKKLRGIPQSQIMADLLSDRLVPGAPFTSVGVDTFGPWTVVTRKTRGGQANSKRWAILFTCLTTRAAHIEVIEELSSSSFINALRRFTAIRGKVTLIRSDRGTNFIGAVDDLNINVVNVEKGPIKDFLKDSGCTWIFNPPHSSHMGGVWERVIGIVKRILNSMLSDVSLKSLTHEVLVTFMAEVCAVLNARPITPISTDPECCEILSPSMLLTQKADVVAVPSGEFDLPDMYRAQWRRVQFLADTFWTRWKRDYLQLLQTRRKWTHAKPNLKLGDIVLLQDKLARRNEWPIGRIVNAIESDDKIVRKVEVRVFRDNKFVTYTRPISEVVPLIED